MFQVHSEACSFPCGSPVFFFFTSIDRSLQGLFNPDGSPLFPEGMVITAHRPPNPMKQRARMPSLVIIEFILEALPHVGTAGQLLHLSLAQSYIEKPDRLHHEPIFFDIADSAKHAQHINNVADTVEKLRKRCVFAPICAFLLRP